MFKLKLIPQHREDILSIKANNAVLTINGEDYDFSPMSAGDYLPFSAVDCVFFVDGIFCDENGDISAALVYPCAPGDVEMEIQMENGVEYSFGKKEVEGDRLDEAQQS
ncbi:hypothetical protein SMX26_001974 [Cronobacter universalis]|nr:hypothetical protein [Cronobacter universalis]